MILKNGENKHQTNIGPMGRRDKEMNIEMKKLKEQQIVKCKHCSQKISWWVECNCTLGGQGCWNCQAKITNDSKCCTWIEGDGKEVIKTFRCIECCKKDDCYKFSNEFQNGNWGYKGD